MSDRDTTKENRTRREVLAASGVTAFAATAGCLTTLPSFGQRVRYGEVNEPDGGPPAYRDWLPATLDTEDGQLPHQALFQRPGSRGESTLGGPVGEYDFEIKNHMDAVGVDIDTFEYVLKLGTGPNDTFVCRGDYDRSAVESALETMGYEFQETYEGYELYRWPPESDSDNFVQIQIALSSDALLYSDQEPHLTKALIDTSEGRRTRRVERDDQLARIASTDGAYPIMSLGMDSETLDEEMGFRAITFDDEAVYAIDSIVYAGEREQTRRDIEAEIESWPEAIEADRVDIRLTDQSEKIVGKLDHETATELLAPIYEYPHITWDKSFDAAAEEVTITPLVGNSVDASVFTVRDISGEYREDEPFPSSETQFTDIGETIGPEDVLRLDVSDQEEWAYRIDGAVPGGDDTWVEYSVTWEDFEQRDDSTPQKDFLN